MFASLDPKPEGRLQARDERTGRTREMATALLSMRARRPCTQTKYFPERESIEKVYQLLEEGGCNTIDTTRVYGDSQEWLSKARVAKRFFIDRQAPGGFIPDRHDHTAVGEGDGRAPWHQRK